MYTVKARAASVALGVLAAMSFAVASAESNSAPRDSSIAFANHGGIWDWQADRERGLWVQSNNRQWYYATFMAPCNGLNFANSLGFDTGPIGSLDRFSSVVVPRWGKCTFTSFQQSDGPPRKHAKS